MNLVDSRKQAISAVRQKIAGIRYLKMPSENESSTEKPVSGMRAIHHADVVELSRRYYKPEALPPVSQPWPSRAEARSLCP